MFSFSPPPNDPLGVLTSTVRVMTDTDWVTLSPDAVQTFASAHANDPEPVHEEDRLHCADLPPEQFYNYLLVLEALNFCFWDDEPRWRVVYQGQPHDGYWALVAALHRGIYEEGFPLWDAEFLACISEELVAHILRGEARPVPLLPNRVEHLQEAGRVLLQNWQGQFLNLVASCSGDAAELARKISAEFSSFQDVASWRGEPVHLLKRAQICVADLVRMRGDIPGGPLKNMEQLTAFADYKVPQVMRKIGVLIPNEALAKRIDDGEELLPGCEEEVALRAGTIWGCEWIARAITHIRAGSREPATAAEVDYLLWSAGQDKTGLKPYHRTRTNFY